MSPSDVAKYFPKRFQVSSRGSQDMVEKFGGGMDCILDVCMPALALRAGEVSNAGRETFLATNSDATIETFVTHLDPTKVSLHPNPAHSPPTLLHGPNLIPHPLDPANSSLPLTTAPRAAKACAVFTPVSVA